MTLAAIPLLYLCFSSALVAAVPDLELTGTWSTKSRKVVTGPDFYDPKRDRLIEPSHAGISYSFTDDGHFESAYYRSIANPAEPSCPKAMMQFQHGTYEKADNGSLILTPFASDGRQLLSNPCKRKNGEYYRYNQTEIFKRYEFQIDGYHNVKRLNLYEFDGSPMQPMYLIMKPPQMLPTETLNPLPTATGTAAATGKSRRNARRDGVVIDEPLNKYSSRKRDSLNLDTWWWLGVLMTSVGGIMLVYSGN